MTPLGRHRAVQMSSSNWHMASVYAIVVFLVALFALALRASSQAMPGPEDTTTVSDKDNGGKIVVSKGSTLVVRLEATPGTGHGWQVVKINRDLLRPLGESRFEKSAGGEPGAVEHQVFRFKAQTPGSTVLEMHYLRPWEKDVPPLRTYRINLEIR